MVSETEMEFTPLMEQYLEIKNKHKDALLLFRLGDFYELFFDDAKKASSVLGITLTSRSKGDKAIPMCGIPHFVANTYIARLLKEGYKVAICDQIGEVKPGRLVERKVTRVITPGTSLESVKELNVDENFICSIYPSEKVCGVAILDVSCGNLFLYEGKREYINSLISLYSISEILISDDVKDLEFPTKIFVTKKPPYWFNAEMSLSNLKEYFEVTDLDLLGFKEYSQAVFAVAFLVKYLKEQFLDAVPKIFKIEWINLEARVFVSEQTYKALEIFENMEGYTDATLFGVINKTLTPMGHRKLKNWLRSPINDIVELQERLNAIEELIQSKNLVNDISYSFKNMADLERLTVKIRSEIATPQELVLINDSLDKIMSVGKLLKDCKSGYFLEVLTNLNKQSSERYLISKKERMEIRDENSRISVVEQIKNLVNKFIDIDQNFGWFIKKSINSELDELKEFYLNSNKWLKNYEDTERKKTGINNLKIGYNEIFGYYIEITRLKSEMIPSYYIRKQTLKNVERYITAELKEFEVKFMRCKEKIEQLEKEIYNKFLSELRQYCSYLHSLSEIIAKLDVILSFSRIALELNWNKPKISLEKVLYLENARHPVLEKFLGKKFVPNEIDLGDKNYFMLITGPNMAGKSTLIKQIALIVFLVHIGSFVPAQNAKVGLVDSIFSRLITRDAISSGKSTFLVEMLECSQILNLATERSFVIMDEIGRGTSTYDGLALAVSIIDYLVNKKKCITLFATHYHELIILENQLQGFTNYHMSVYEWNGEFVFLYKLQKGAIDRSFGIYVAKLAGLPKDVILAAKNLLSKIERKTSKEFADLLGSYKTFQLPIFNQNFEKIISELKKINYNNLTPMEALFKLKELKELMDEKN